MNKLLSSMADICQDYPLDEKVLIVPSYSAGHELCEALARTRGGWVNLYAETVGGLANKIAAEYLAGHNITLLNSTLATTIVEEVIRKLYRKKALCYFNKKEVYAGLVKALANTVFELRLYGVTSEKLNAADFVDPQKGRDMKNILREYENYLAEHGYIDYPGLITLAAEIAQTATPTDDKIYILPSFIKLSTVEGQLLERITAGNLKVIDADSLEDSGFNASLSLFHAYGIKNEVKEIIRRLQFNNVHLDTATIAYTSEDYIPVIYSLAKQLGIKLTVAEGLPVFFTSPGRVLKALIEWIKQNYSIAVFKDLLLSGDFCLKCEESEEEISPNLAARILAGSGVGWGRERYYLLDKLAQTYLVMAESAEEEYKKDHYLKQSKLVERISTIMQRLFSYLPAADDDKRVNFRDFTGGIVEVLARFTRIKDEDDAAALKVVVSFLTETGQMATFKLDINEALERMENILSGCKVNPAASKAGHLHVVSYQNLIWTARPHTYIVGLDANTFPGSGRQDPILLDVERVRISGALPLGRNKPEDNRRALSAALASCRGNIVLSYSSFNLCENRDMYPSFILLQAYRLLMNDHTLDYSNLIDYLGKPAAFCPQEGKPALDETEWWMNKVLNYAVINGRDLVKQCYQTINRGNIAYEARKSIEPTEFDGLIPQKTPELDPRKNKDIVMSCSRIEYLASCPYAYFLKYVLGLYPLEEVISDRFCWLDALSRGSLLHEIYYQFMRTVKEKGERVKADVHRKLIFKIADRLIAKYKELVPPPSEAVFEQEVQDIYNCCEVFLNAEEQLTDIRPAFFEVPFGYGVDAVKECGGIGLANPIEIKLTADTGFRLMGKIDRIDKNSDGTYTVWDYKTGSTYGYEDNKFLDKGRQIQHALYALAAEEIIKAKVTKEDIKVKYSGYCFPTVKGEGQRIIRNQGNKGAVIEVLNCLFDILATGSFIAAHDGEKCDICDYTEICNPQVAVQRAKELLLAGSSCLKPWRRLADID